jgi:hypothetical protein
MKRRAFSFSSAWWLVHAPGKNGTHPKMMTTNQLAAVRYDHTEIMQIPMESMPAFYLECFGISTKN